MQRRKNVPNRPFSTKYEFQTILNAQPSNPSAKGLAASRSLDRKGTGVRPDRCGYLHADDSSRAPVTGADRLT
ncbi:hypothetical protein JTE90_009494 [Oedothorax gibbosus]|uniref:Uncharacterized protein n=1 Tax=Oedothorax gibbosus TaxID=931172 RepID=A0AAV6UUU4_9ARAC|nr:hypothetical protein JTE90_009494 [Oedothorax gibbosus]